MVEQQVSNNNESPKKIKKTKRKTGRLFLLGFILISFMIIIAPVITVFFISDSYSLVEESATVNADSATKAKHIVKTIYTDLTHAESTESFNITLVEKDINGVMALAMRGVNGLKGRVNVTSVGIKGAFSFNTRWNPFGDYINLTATVVPSSSGLYLTDFSIGRLVFSGEFAVSVAEKALNLLLSGDDIGTQLVEAIESISVDGREITVAYHAVPSLKQSIKQTAGKVKNIRNDLTLLASPADVKAYYLNICQLHSKIGDLGKVPLAYYLSDTFSFAGRRTLLSQSPVKENKAGMLALAIFLGDPQFDSFIGAIDMETFERCQPKGNNIVLANRNDLRLHFIFSAALKIISDSSISFAIGEFKELLDSGSGGTGFSFTDLAADRSGIRFSELALSENGAARLQYMAADLTKESAFFISLSQLPDGFSQAEFDGLGGLNGQFYKKHLSLINERIKALPLYK